MPGLLATLAAALFLQACATAPMGPVPVGGGHDRPAAASRPPPPPVERPRPERFADLPGWAQEDHAAAFDAFRATCQAARDPAMSAICRRAMTVDLLDPAHAKAFFEDNFTPQALPGEGVLTAYFAPEYQARRRPDDEFSAPVRGKPADLITKGGDALRKTSDGAAGPYPDRAWIENQGIETPGGGEVLAWMRPEELFFLQIQGSGVLTYADGRRTKVLYAANNGKPFVGIANPMRDRGLLAANNTSGDAIRSWLADHRGPEADEIMRLNPRYAFFRLAPDDGLPPIGAAGLPLPSGRAIAVDLSRHGLGELYWMDAVAPTLAGAFPTYRRLVTSLDTGGAIKGDIRADLYLGQGAAAGAEAGRVRHTLRLHRLVPRP
jgi:membrane-bound lytic murein transglycosylase A